MSVGFKYRVFVKADKSRTGIGVIFPGRRETAHIHTAEVEKAVYVLKGEEKISSDPMERLLLQNFVNRKFCIFAMA